MPDRKWNARDYAENSAVQLDWARELIRKLDLEGDEEILDIGSGDGKVTAELASLVPRGTVVGIDSSRAMVDFARQRCARSRHPNLRFESGDARALSFDATFDVVFSNATLHWVTDHRPVLDGISRALRPRGRALLQMGGKGNAADIIATLKELASAPQWTPYLQGLEFPYGFHSPAEYADWLGDTELEARRLELILKDMLQPGKQGLEGWIRTTWFPFAARMPDGLADEFYSELTERYIDHHPLDAAGMVHVRMVRLEADLVKRETLA